MVRDVTREWIFSHEGAHWPVKFDVRDPGRAPRSFFHVVGTWCVKYMLLAPCHQDAG